MGKMRALLLIISFIVLIQTITYAQVGIGTNTPDPSAALEINSKSKGFLPPRIALTATNISVPINSPSVGLLVYSTDSMGTYPNNIIPGYYYWDGLNWIKLATGNGNVNTGNARGDMQYWNGSRWVIVPGGITGQTLTYCNGIPTWGGCPSGISDIDGNIYDTVVIGTQTWMRENLKTTHYRNGDVIPNIVVSSQWVSDTIGAYCNYLNNVSNVNVYGRLYNWYAVNKSVGLCPFGWHIPSNAEWTILINYLGGSGLAGGTLKSIGTILWSSPNVGATNSSNFTGLPAGSQGINGGFFNIGTHADFWSSTGFPNGNAYYYDLFYNSVGALQGTAEKVFGCSCRCIKD